MGGHAYILIGRGEGGIGEMGGEGSVSGMERVLDLERGEMAELGEEAVGVKRCEGGGRLVVVDTGGDVEVERRRVGSVGRSLLAPLNIALNGLAGFCAVGFLVIPGGACARGKVLMHVNGNGNGLGAGLLCLAPKADYVCFVPALAGISGRLAGILLGGFVRGCAFFACGCTPWEDVLLVLSFFCGFLFPSGRVLMLRKMVSGAGE